MYSSSLSFFFAIKWYYKCHDSTYCSTPRKRHKFVFAFVFFPIISKIF